VPGFRFRNSNDPFWSDVVERVLLSSKRRIVTVAPGTTACVLSSTTPTTLPKVDCALTDTLLPTSDRTIMAAAMPECTILRLTTALVVTALPSARTHSGESNLSIGFGVHALCPEASRDVIKKLYISDKGIVKLCFKKTITCIQNVHKISWDRLFVVIVTALVKPLGGNMERVFSRKRTVLDRSCLPVERLIYRITAVDPEGQMTGREYATCFVLFGLTGTLLLYAILRTQQFLPWFFPQYNTTPLSPDLAFNTAISFSTITT
jgi:potassium-transporting ATPase A subunit